MSMIDLATIKVFDGIENTQARVVHSQLSGGEPGFGVILFDLDAEQSVGGIRVYRNLDIAVEYAESLVAAT